MGGQTLPPRALGGHPQQQNWLVACSGQAGLWRGRRDKRKSQGTEGPLTFFGSRWGAFRHAPCTCSRNPGTGSGPPRGLLPPQAHTGLRGTQSHPEFHTVTRLHTHRRDRRLWGLRQRLLCCSCPKMWGGGETPPGEEPREGNGWEQVPGPVPTPGEGLPGPQALLVPCRPGCPLPLLHAAPEGSWGTLELSEGRKPRQGPRAATRTLANPRPAGASSAHVGWQWQ